MTLRLLCLTALLSLAACAQAQGATLGVVGAANDAPLSDGGRWAVIWVHGGMEIIDGRTLARRTVDLAGPCAAQFGQPRAVASGLVLVECSYSVKLGKPKLLVYDLTTRTFTDVPGTEILLRGSDGSTVSDVGRSWIAFALTGHRGESTPGLLNWHTGKAAPAPAFARDHVIDLDAPSATRPICRAIRRPASRRRLFIYRKPFALVDRGTASRHRLVLERCDRRPRALATGSSARSVSLGARAVAWIDGATIHARSLRDGRERTWRAPPGKAVLGLAEIGSRLLVMIQGGPYGGPQGFGFTVYSGRLP
ncbi:MAG TPA: hypothetical protein VL120_07220 [Solirubrobacteraceae bacterium]|nr:hypothetical protein [Solirubrobacteraceae bacterium]